MDIVAPRVARATSDAPVSPDFDTPVQGARVPSPGTVGRYVAEVRISHAATPRHRRSTTAPARYRVDFFAEVERSGASPRGETGPTWWLVERAYIDDADIDEVLSWAYRQAGSEARFALYLEQHLEREEGEVVVVTLLAGQNPLTGEE